MDEFRFGRVSLDEVLHNNESFYLPVNPFFIKKYVLVTQFGMFLETVETFLY